MGLKLSRICLKPLMAVCGGQQSSFPLHFPFPGWHSYLQLAMCRWQHLPTVLSSSKPSGDGCDRSSGLQKELFQKRNLAVWAKKRGSAGCW